LQSFNNLLISLPTIFQALTLEGWVDAMYNLMDAGNTYSAPLYYLVIVIFGAFFLMNLILAAIMDSFSKVDKEMAVAEFKREFRGVEQQAKITIRQKISLMQIMNKQISIVTRDVAGREKSPSINEEEDRHPNE
jgi:Ion transport protein